MSLVRRFWIMILRNTLLAISIAVVAATHVSPQAISASEFSNALERPVRLAAADTTHIDLGQRLSDDEMERIKAEEIYRKEVRRKLAHDDPWQSNIYDFFQSSLGIWVLSTLVIGGLSFAYSQWDKQRWGQTKMARQRKTHIGSKN